jgi:uncharacterized protein YdhG (YjbR/CyaY superfamily)
MAREYETVDQYLASFSPGVRAILEQIRRRIRAAVPQAEERISYHIAAFAVDGRDLVYMAGWKRHVSIYPVPSVDGELERQLRPYLTGKGTLKFPLGDPIPYDLIERVASRLADERA